MHIRTKITAIFILLTGLFQVCVFVIIYTFFKNHNESEFYQRMDQRASITAQVYLKNDEKTIDLYNNIERPNILILPDEKELIIPIQDGEYLLTDSLRNQIPPALLMKVKENTSARIKLGDLYFLGKKIAGDGKEFMVMVSARDQYGVEKLKYLSNLLIITYGVSFVFIFALGQYFSKQALSPISKIIKKVNDIKAENLSVRLDTINSEDELSQLSDTFNEMLDRLQISFDLQSNFINNASHELRNPLSAIIGKTEIALNKKRTTEEYESTLQDIEKEANKLNEMVNGLLELAKTDFSTAGLVINSVRIDQVLIEIKQSLETYNAENKVSINFGQLPKDERLVTINGSETMIKVALRNIIENACKFSLQQEAFVNLSNTSTYITVIIRDEGVGIPPEDLDKIFEPFYRGANVRKVKGFGFGLSLARRIIKLHGGDIRISSQVGKGTLLTIKIPNINQDIS